MGLDVGERRIGVALSDPSGLIATPLTTIHRTSATADAAEVVRLAHEHGAQRVVVGIPVSLDGQERRQARAVRRFLRLLKEACPLPVVTWDERLSTVEAERLLRQAGVEAPRDRARLDAAAAAVILQGWLDAQRLRETPS